MVYPQFCYGAVRLRIGQSITFSGPVYDMAVRSGWCCVRLLAGFVLGVFCDGFASFPVLVVMCFRWALCVLEYS